MQNTMSPCVSVEDFAQSFGTTVDEIPDDCRELISTANFQYSILQGSERDNVILEVLKKIESDTQVIGATERKGVWEKGWQENLDAFVESGCDLKELVPKFVRAGQVIRLNGNYVVPENKNFELDYYRILRRWLFRKFLSPYKNIYEFGCGTGFNLVEMASIYPEKVLHGLDFVQSSVDLVNKLPEGCNGNISGHLFDMIHPDESFVLDEDSAVFTIGAIEQLASRFESFLQFLLARGPRLCLHVEPTIELYDESLLFDYLAAKFHKKRGYTQGLLTRLRDLEKQNKVEILMVNRPFFGSLFMEGYSCIVWRPLPA